MSFSRNYSVGVIKVLLLFTIIIVIIVVFGIIPIILIVFYYTIFLNWCGLNKKIKVQFTHYYTYSSITPAGVI